MAFPFSSSDTCIGGVAIRSFHFILKEPTFTCWTNCISFFALQALRLSIFQSSGRISLLGGRVLPLDT